MQDYLLSGCYDEQGEHDGLVLLSLGTSVVAATVTGGCLISRAVKSAKAKKREWKEIFHLLWSMINLSKN